MCKDFIIRQILLSKGYERELRIFLDYINLKFYYLIYCCSNFENKMSDPIITQVATPYRMPGLNE